MRLAFAFAFALAGCGGNTGPTAPPAVTPIATSIALSATSLLFPSLGDNVQVQATVLDQLGRPITGTPVSWSSSQPQIATVSGSGLVTAVANGATTITATSGAIVATVPVVVAAIASSLLIAPGADTLVVGGSKQLTVQAFDARRNPLDVSPVWRSSDTRVANVTASGLVSAVGAGSAFVIASAGSAVDTVEIGVANAASILSTAFPNGVSRATARAGDTVVVAVTLDMNRVSNSGNIGSLNLQLFFDPSLFALAGISNGLIGSAAWRTDVAGQVTFAFISTSTQVSPRITPLTVRLVARAGAPIGRISRLSISFLESLYSTDFSSYGTPIGIGGKIVIGG